MRVEDARIVRALRQMLSMVRKPSLGRRSSLTRSFLRRERLNLLKVFSFLKVFNVLKVFPIGMGPIGMEGSWNWKELQTLEGSSLGEVLAEAGRDYGVIKGLQPFLNRSESASYFYLSLFLLKPCYLHPKLSPNESSVHASHRFR